MEEFERITNKYKPDYIEKHFESLEEIHVFSLQFFKDVADIYDGITRLRNLDRNPSGFSIDDAPILGLLVRVSKLLKECVKSHKAENAEVIAIFERPLIEATTIATYLMRNDGAVMEDYRKCSYKDRLRLLRKLKEGSPFSDTKAGKRLLASVQDKLNFEGLTKDDFAEQRKNKWRLQGKSFRDIFASVERDSLYPATYGMMSESIHGSWNESMDWGLVRNEDGTFAAFTDYRPADIRSITPVVKFTITPFRLWLQRIDCYDDNLQRTMGWIERLNIRLFQSFDNLYAGEYD
ncbi:MULTISPECIES: DUF5677 domain-containing protein [unclassified Rhizobium]|uniref:DUF5677 domain-containing protein n=1 Tax=unclassified Rhizobium TaxID=2613769 RepID=UPI001ADCAC74|nr:MULTISPECIES: DUF5677 domain-containing protein [unclassified Rhizobium]MBO9100739.1 hypothetical protein [Rhizobium sp. L58/93]MBO9135897.1 hypothetical protein [Rhizobium sp. B209b/85]MBO9171209.1 hypothetical protein [Rhizobium sp. L245/93]MBO9187078.1 hypothetical protein [Rhizobium sp. E27B/91]QXZ88052.1 hypothetical protein J5287_29240 [Rhizobium sp. K1/93]